MSVEDLVHGWAEMDRALPDYVAAEDADTGYVHEVFPDPVLQAKLEPMADRYRFPLAAIPIDVMADRVKLRAVMSGDAATDEAIARIAKANQLEVRFSDLFRTVFKYGDGYLMTWPAPEQTGPGIKSREIADAGVVVDVRSPKHCRMFYDEESERTPVRVITRWRVRTPTGTAWRADQYYPGFVERYQSKTGEPPLEPDSWVKYVDADDDGEGNATDGAWPIETPTEDELPFTHFRTDMPYGVPVHVRVYGCQDAVTKMLVTQLDTTDSHGWPQRYRLLSLGAELDQATDNPDWTDDADAADDSGVAGGVATAGRSGPGTVQTFTGTQEVGQFSAADPAVFLDPAKFYIRLMAQLSNTPLHYFDPSGEPPTGESLKVADIPVKNHAERFQAMFSDAVRGFWDYSLRVASITGKAPSDPAPVDPKWATISAIGTSAWEEVRAKQDAGVPIPETLVEAGYPQERVDEWDLPTHPVDFAGSDQVGGMIQSGGGNSA